MKLRTPMFVYISPDIHKKPFLQPNKKSRVSKIMLTHDSGSNNEELTNLVESPRKNCKFFPLLLLYIIITDNIIIF